MSTNVYLIEHYLPVQVALQEYINAMPGLIICGAASSGSEALAQIPQLDVDLILIDPVLSDINGFEVIAQLHELYPALPMIVLSIYQHPDYVNRALAAGVRGYILKGYLSSIKQAIQSVLAGEIYLSPQLSMD